MYKNTKMGGFPGDLAVKDPALLSLLWLWFNPWPQELVHAAGMAKNNNNNKKEYWNGE